MAQVPEPSGWYAGDMHVHRSCGGSPEGLSSMYGDMSTNNLAVISLLADMGNGEVQDPTTDLPLVNGQDASVSTPGRIVHWDTEWHWDATYNQYAHQALGGHIVALGLSSAQQIWQEYTYPILNWAHQQGGIAGFAHMQYLDGNFPTVLTCCSPVEYPVEVALGAADFISEDVADSGSQFYDSGTSVQIPMNPEVAIAAYYKLLNSGFRPGFAAGTDYPCNSSHPLGNLLTYAQPAGGQMTYENWINAISKGRTVVSRNGHDEFLSLTVNGSATPGDEIDLPAAGVVQVSIQWTATQSLSGTIELVNNGVVVASKSASASPGAPATWTSSLNFAKSGWLAARRMGADGHQVHTAAVFVIVNGAPIRASATDAQYYANWMTSLLNNTSPGGAWNSYFPTSLSAAQARYQAAKALFQQIQQEAQGTAPALSSITITPANQHLQSGTTQQFIATGNYSIGNSLNLTAQVVWASSNTSVANINVRGLTAAVNPGPTTISARLGSVSANTSVTVQASLLTITTQSLPAGTVGVSYSTTLAASGGTPQYTWSIASGSLPVGTALNASTGVISGTPTTAGTFNFTAQVVDSGSPAQVATQALSIIIAGASSCPCTIWPGGTTPGIADAGPDAAVELGVRFRADTNGFITGIRFYKGTGNTGTHGGNLWSNSGSLLATATFTGETASGWQQVNFSSPVSITAGTVYVASYHTNVGHYADDQYYFASAGYDRAPLHALQDGVSGPDGVFAYGSGSAFPNQGWHSSNYWVDVVFASGGADTTPPTVISVSPSAGASGVVTTTPVTATFSEAIDPTTVSTSTFLLLDANNVAVSATVTYNSANNTATLTPASGLLNSTTYTARIKGGGVDPRIKDLAGNALASDFTWSFTTAAPPPPPPSDGPGGPILIVSSSSNPFSRYYTEILRAEGLNEFTAMDISLVSASTLSAYDVVILGDVPLTSAQVSTFSNWVNGGGNLIAMHPDKQLAGLLGLVDAGATLSDAYLLMSASGPGSGLVGQSIQFHGSADRYTLGGATSLATLYSSAATPTSNPAVTLHTAGLGQAAAFTYDLARSIVYTRQGNPAWSGQARDGNTPMRSDDLYFGDASFDPQPDWVDFNKIAIPQADEQQRLLANLILQMNTAKKPLPRFWYFPRGLKAVVVMTGDDHGSFYSGGATAARFDQYLADSPAGCNVNNWECVRASAYLFPPSIASNPLTGSQAANYIAQGFEVAAHVDSNPDCSDWTSTSLNSAYTSVLTSFAATWPSAPAPQTHRMHCVSWSNYDSQPQVELSHGIRLDTTYYYWPDSWINDRPGMFTGSGMPMRFAKQDGTLIDVYQAATQMTDESGQSYPLNIDTLLDNALGTTGYYGVFTANMHADVADSSGADAIVASAQARGVPIVSALQMLKWLDGRNSSAFGSLAWSGNTLSFSVQVGANANGLQVLLPANAASGPLASITLNGSSVAYTRQTIKGISYAVFTASGTGTYSAVYSGSIALSSLTLNPSTVQGGGASTGTVTLSAAAPAQGLTVALTSSNTAVATVPANITVPGGSTTATFTVSTVAVTTSTAVTISGSYSGSNVNSSLTVTPVANLSALALTPTAVIGGNASTGTVTFSYQAPSGGATVALSSSNTGVATVPASVTIAAGATTATFNVTTFAVASATNVSITASYSGTTKTAALTVNPPALSSVTLNPASVAGGSPSTGTVQLTGIAPAGGAVISLSSSNTAAVTVPASVTVAAGASTANFTASTLAVASNTTVTITAIYAGITKTATLTVTPKKLAIDKTVFADRSSNGSSITAPTFSTAAPNELLLAFISADAPSSGTNTTVTGVTGGGLSWALVRRTNAQLGTAEIWRAFAPTPLASISVKATLSRSVAASITVMTFTGVDTSGTAGSGAIGATGSGNASSGAPTASLITTRNNSWVFGVGTDWDRAVARAVGAGQSLIHQYLATIGDTYWVQSQTSPTAQNGTMVTINDTSPTSDRYNLTIVEILPAP